jgi:hypothetical protein
MGREDPFIVRYDSLPGVADGNSDRAIMNRVGSLVVTDLMTQLILSGYGYHMQIGTEDAGVASTTSIDDQLAWMVCDNQAGSAMLPLLFEVNIGVLAGATLAMSMLEVDKDKVRYSSGGTAFVPANLRTDDPNSAGGSFYVGTDVTTAAKSAVPNSVELARKEWVENALADTIGYPMASNPVVYSMKDRPLMVLLDASSVVCHHGAATADATSYGVLQFAQFPKAMVKAS